MNNDTIKNILDSVLLPELGKNQLNWNHKREGRTQIISLYPQPKFVFYVTFFYTFILFLFVSFHKEFQ